MASCKFRKARGKGNTFHELHVLGMNDVFIGTDFVD